ncbi:hypothetical protein HYV81_06225 [Candidatus Woesearchaeota archaeon]|nr:hypothetical protein [Candidatus Woesearchaeota archaeon]
MTQTLESDIGRSWSGLEPVTLYNFVAGEFRGKPDIQFAEFGKKGHSHANILARMLHNHGVAYPFDFSLVYTREPTHIPRPSALDYKVIAMGAVMAFSGHTVFHPLETDETLYQQFGMSLEKMAWVRQHYPHQPTEFFDY